MTTLTALEIKVLVALYNSAAVNGHDFGFIEDGRSAVNAPRQLSGIVTSLQSKGIIEVHAPVTTDAGTFTQFTWNLNKADCDAYELAPKVAELLAKYGEKVTSEDYHDTTGHHATCDCAACHQERYG